jgi:MFS family permease
MFDWYTCKMANTKPKLFFGWFLAVVLGFMFFMANGSLLTSAAISNPLMGESLHMSASELGLGVTLVILAYGLGAPIIGFIISRIGARWTQVIGGCLMILGASGLAFIVKSPLLYYVYFTVLGVSTIMVGQLSVETTVSAWFVRYRGIAMSLTMAIGGLGAFVSPLIANALITGAGFDWRAAWYFFIGTGALAIVLALFVVRNRPQDIDLQPDGISEEDWRRARKSSTRTTRPVVYKYLEKDECVSALRTPRFWLIACIGTAGFLFYSLSTGVSTLHFASIGIDRMAIVGGVSSMGLSMLVGKLVCGVISDRIEPVRILAFCDAIIAIAVLTSVLIPSFVSVYIFYSAAGFAYGGIVPCLPTAVANHFGAKAMPKNIGMVMCVGGLTSAAVPIAGGMLFDLIGSYAPVFIGVASIATLCAIMGFLLKIPEETTRAAD